MSTSFLSKNLFNKETFNIFYTLKNKNKFKTTILLNIDNLKHVLINKKFARKICDKLIILFQKLVKVKFIRKYNEKTNVVIIDIIYFILIVNEHQKNFIFLLIIKLKNHKLILKRL